MRSVDGRRTRPVVVLTGWPHICVSFCTMCAAVVCEEQATVATTVLLRSAKLFCRRSALPHPSGPCGGWTGGQRDAREKSSELE